MSRTLREAAEALREASYGLHAALAQQEPQALAEALDARARVFERFVSQAQGATLAPELRALLDELNALDARTLASAQAALADAGRALAHLAEGRRALAALRGELEPPRFLSQRV